MKAKHQFEDKYYPHQKIDKWAKPTKHPDYGAIIDGREKLAKKQTWTPEDQAIEEMLWAS